MVGRLKDGDKEMRYSDMCVAITMLPHNNYAYTLMT